MCSYSIIPLHFVLITLNTKKKKKLQFNLPPWRQKAINNVDKSQGRSKTGGWPRFKCTITVLQNFG